MSKKKVTSLVWFRNNLRVLDNISLTKSIEESDKTIGYLSILIQTIIKKLASDLKK